MLEAKILSDLKNIDEVVDIHIQTFTGFFLTFLGKGFLRHLYKGFIIHDKSNIIGAFDESGNMMGFLAYSEDISELYRHLLKKSIIPFAWYSFIAFLKKPKIMFRLLRAFTYSNRSKSEDPYIELSSIGVLPAAKNKGIGTMLISELKNLANTNKFKYIKLETDKINNDSVNAFYLKNGFKLYKSYVTCEGRQMNEYRYELINN